MISIQEALDLVKTVLPQPQTEEIPLEDAIERVLAQPVFATEPMPQFTNSAMDGFAVRWDDVQFATEAQPVNLQIAGESRAGVPADAHLASGEAMRISTGAMVGNGADTVVPIENTEINEQMVSIKKVNHRHQHLRFAGEEYAAGTELLTAGTVLNPAQIAVAASQGAAMVAVYRCPRVAIIGTGTELVDVAQTPVAGQIRDSNGIMLAAAVQKFGGKVVSRQRVGDDFSATVAAIEHASAVADVILFSGGVSVGPHDLVKKAAQECGFETIFWRVRQKPGKPLYFARTANTLLFGLPGNPVSAYMCFLYYVQPVLKFANGTGFNRRRFTGVLAAQLENRLDRDQLFRVNCQYPKDSLPIVSPQEKQASHMLTSVSNASGFIVLPAGQTLQKGVKAEVLKMI